MRIFEDNSKANERTIFFIFIFFVKNFVAVLILYYRCYSARLLAQIS